MSTLFPSYPELSKCFNRIKNGRRVYPQQITALHSKMFGVEPKESILKNFFKRLPTRGIAVTKQDGDGEFFKIKAITPAELDRISVSKFSYENRKWE